MILSRAGVASRRQAERMILDGQVRVNGRVVTELGTRAHWGVDHIKVGGRLLRAPARLDYYAYHKPVGCVTTMEDPQGRFCVGDVVRELAAGMRPVGRLDYQTSGLLLLTNDGELAARVSRARYGVPKTYLAKVHRLPTHADVERLRDGIRLDDGPAAALHVRLVRASETKAWLEISIAEGRNRQVRRMLEAVGFHVEKLRRVSIGPLRLGNLAMGQLRRLEPAELQRLRVLVGLGG